MSRAFGLLKGSLASAMSESSIGGGDQQRGGGGWTMMMLLVAQDHISYCRHQPQWNIFNISILLISPTLFLAISMADYHMSAHTAPQNLPYS